LNVEWVLLVKQQSMEGIGSQRSIKINDSDPLNPKNRQVNYDESKPFPNRWRHTE
jgi:hypothetical protein